MLYTRSLEIERRLSALLGLVGSGRHSTPSLAKALGVSVPTVSRCISALRARGHNIRAIKRSEGWAFVLDAGKRTRSRSAAPRR